MTQSQRNQNKYTSLTWLLLFTLIGFGLRLHNLSFQPLWGDEGWSFYFAGQSIPHLVALTAIDIHPPLYYLLLKGWLFLGGSTPESARFLSVIIGTLLIPATYGLGTRLFGRRVGVLSAAIVAGMPLAIYYAQEVRMYGLVTLLGAISSYFFLRMFGPNQRVSLGRRSVKVSRVYIVVAAAALYTMYYASLLILAQFVAAMVIWWREKQRSLTEKEGVFQRVKPFIYIGLLYTPWLIYATPRLLDYIGNKRDVEGYTPLNFIHFFGDHFIAFSVGHLANEAFRVVWVALPFVCVVSVGFLAVLYGYKYRSYTFLFLYLFIPMLIGYGINQLYPFNPPYFERTLLLAAPAFWLFMAAGLIWLWDRTYILGGVIGLVLLIMTGLSLDHFYTTPRYPHEDYRPILKNIAARSLPEDTLIASYQWQIGFYQAYLPSPRPRIFTVPGWGEGWADEKGAPQLNQDLTQLLDTSARLWFPAHQTLGHFWEDQAETAIADLGFPALREWPNQQTKLILAGGTPSLTFVDGPTAKFDDRLTLTKSTVGQQVYEAGRGIIPLELQWRKERSVGSEFLVSLRLADGAGRTWATRDSKPQTDQITFPDLDIGEEIIDRHGLLVPAGTPPGMYRLLLSLRRVGDAHPLDLRDATGQPLGIELEVAQIEVVTPSPQVGPDAVSAEFVTDAMFGQQVQLVGYNLAIGPFQSGSDIPIDLFWYLSSDVPPSVEILLQLENRGGEVIASQQYPPLYPAEFWPQGGVIHDVQTFTLPPILNPGHYYINVGLVMADQTHLPVAGENVFRLNQIAAFDRPRNFNSPQPQFDVGVTFGEQAELVGIDLPETAVSPGDTLPLTLYWQAKAPLDRSWTVFVHLIDEAGQIVAQVDQIPGGGEFPTKGWVPDEYLTDSYNLILPADVPLSEGYQLRLGLYDANDFSRLPIFSQGEIVSDHLILENWPISVE
ncbi:MAG: glycosyltransferase family 39 protein [Chloroflexota bacterium]